MASARTLAIEPSPLLLDEPFGALDAKVRKSLRAWLWQMHDRMGLTSILVTHDQAEAMEMADRVAVLQTGRMVQIRHTGSAAGGAGDAVRAGVSGRRTG